MDYTSDSKGNYMEGLRQANPAIASAFSPASTSRLGGVLDMQYQQRRSNYDNGNTFANSQIAMSQQSTYGIGIASSGAGLLSDNSYGSLPLGSYDTGGDWNSNSVRSLGGMGSIDNGYGLSSASNSFFQPSTGSADWSSGLRGSDPLGLQNGGGYDLQGGMGLAPLSHSHGLGGYGQQPQQQRGMGPGGNRYQASLIAHPGPRAYMPNQHPNQFAHPGTGGSNAQGRALNKMLLDILRERTVDPNRLAMAIDANIERMDCVNLATLLFHTGKKRLLLTPSFIKRIAFRFSSLKEELRAREASNALYGLKCMSSECPEVRQLVFALASKVGVSMTELVAQAVGNALYGCQMMTSDHEEVRYLLQVLAVKVSQCTELLEAQNVGNALYGLRGMNSDCKEVRMLIAALTPKIATAREELNGQALGNSLYGLQGMNSREIEVRTLLSVLATKVARTWEDLKAQEVGNALYGLKRMNSDCAEVRQLIEALVPKVASSPEILDAQAIGNSFYGMQNMKSDNAQVLMLLATMAEKVMLSPAELDGQAMGNSLYGMQGMRSDQPEVRAVVSAITLKMQSSCLEMNAQELGNAVYGLQRMTSDYPEVRKLLIALTQKVGSSKHELTSQEIGNALFGLQGMRSDCRETRALVRQLAVKISQSTSLIDPQGIANSLFGIQNMTSDNEEVRTLLQVLAMKIEHSWKLLSAQHISNSLFGMQGLCSAEPEVLALVHSFVPKILASRDEMTPKQVCNALFGLRNMSSVHEEVRSLLGPLTEKLNLCSQLIPLQNLSAAFFGLQGLESDYDEVRGLLVALGEKLAMVDEIDAYSLGNCLFGLQRMSSSYPEVLSIVELLSPMLSTLADSGLEINSKVCGNVLYGLQNCSVAEECVQKIIQVILSRIKEFIASYSQFVVPGGSSGDSSILFPDMMLLHQALTLALQAIPDLHLDPELNEDLRAQQQQLYTIVNSRKHDYAARALTSSEQRLAESLADALAEEPFVVSTGELLHGFESVITIRLRPGISLQTEQGHDWNPVLNIEVGTPADNSPQKELFNRLRANYLGQEHGVAVQIIPMSAIIGKSRGSLRECLMRSSDLFTSLYPPTPEDAARFASILSAMGLCRPDDILASLRAVETVGSDGGSFFSMGGTDSFLGDFDDGLDGMDSMVDYFDSRGNLSSRVLKRSATANPLGWIGDNPLPSTSKSNSPCSSPSTHYLTPHPMLQRRQLQSQYKMVVASPMPTGSRAVNPPFIQVGPPPAPAPLPSSIAATFSNSNASSRVAAPIAPVGAVPISYSKMSPTIGSGLLQGSPSGLSPALGPSGHYVPVSMAAHAMLNSPLSSTGAPNSRLISSNLAPIDGDAGRLPYVAISAHVNLPIGAKFDMPSAEQPLSSPDDLGVEDMILSGQFHGESGKTDNDGTEQDEKAPADVEIALLEAQLEIKRMEARLLALKKAKM